MPTTPPDFTAQKQRILTILEGWFAEEKQRKTLRKFVKKMAPKQTTKASEVMKKSSSAPSSLSRYLAWFRGERAARTALLQKITPVSRKGDLVALQSSMLRLGRPLSRREVRRIFKSNQSIAEYLASLSVAQLETYKEAIEKNVVRMPPAVKKTLIMLFSKLQEEQFKREQDWHKKVGPLAEGIAKALQIRQRIDALEQIQASLPSE